MFFTRMAWVIAILAFVLGVGRTFMGFGIATEQLGPYQETLQRYAPGYASSGEVINKGLLYVVCAIALGTLAEIGYSLHRRTELIKQRMPDEEGRRGG